VKEKYDRRVIHLAFRYLIDKNDNSIALWGARRPEELEPVNNIFNWKLTDDGIKKIDEIVEKNVGKPDDPKYMAPPNREELKQG
jgi:aryl-alcohol dehydrogenase-like predicted oxidoreductase